MSTAEAVDTTTDTIDVTYSLEDLEAPLSDMREALGIVRKLALDCETPPTKGEWVSAICHVERWANDLAETLAAMLEKQDAREDQLLEELEALKKQRAVVGSPDDLRHTLWLRGMLRGMAQVVLQETEQSEPPTVGSAAVGHANVERDITGLPVGFGDES